MCKYIYIYMYAVSNHALAGSCHSSTFTHSRVGRFWNVAPIKWPWHHWFLLIPKPLDLTSSPNRNLGPSKKTHLQLQSNYTSPTQKTKVASSKNKKEIPFCKSIKYYPSSHSSMFFSWKMVGCISNIMIVSFHFLRRIFHFHHDSGKISVIHLPKQTWNLKMDPWKRRFLLETIISRLLPLILGGVLLLFSSGGCEAFSSRNPRKIPYWRERCLGMFGIWFLDPNTSPGVWMS